MTLTPTDKTVLTKYPLAPSKCVICLRGSNGELNFIDFQMSLDIYGSVNLCVDCVATVAQLIGFVEKNFLTEVEDQLRNMIETNRELYKENAELNATLDNLLNLRPNLDRGSVSANEGPDKTTAISDGDLTLDISI